VSATNPTAPVARTKGRPKGTGAQRVFDGLRDDILHLRLPPGAPIDEATLERQFRVSRTPVREALIRLAGEGLVALLPNRGAQVSQIDFAEVPQFFEAMDVCQRLILRLAATRRSDGQIADLRRLNEAFRVAAEAHDAVAMSETNKAFHAVIAEAGGNRHVQDWYEDLLTTGLRLALSAFGTAFEADTVDEAYYRTVVDQHDAMIDALAARDAGAADALGRAHTDLFRHRLVQALQHGGAQDFPLD